MNKIVKNIPNSITCLNLLSGCLAVVMAFNLDKQIGCLSGRELAYALIGAAAVFDFCDGFAARLLKAYSELGKQLDSLCDLVSFGVAPGMLMYNTMIACGTPMGLALCAMLIPVCGALRLAKFNIDETQATTFRGLPIPANAIFWIGVSGWIAEYGYPGFAIMAVLIVLISLAMVSNIRMFSLKFKDYSFNNNVKRYAIIMAAIAFVVLYGVDGLAWTIALYIFISIFSRRRDGE